MDAARETLDLGMDAPAAFHAAPCSAFRAIVADPPWRPSLHADNPRRATVDKAGPQKHYPTMLLDDICKLSPPAAPQCHLWLWVLTQHVDWGYAVARAWGFDEVATMLTWCKPGLGVGRFQCNTEHVLVCRKGKREGNPFGSGGRVAATTGGTYFNWPRGRHSEKPDAFYDLVERVSPGPRLEMFARTRRLGWSAWGNEIANDVEMPNGEHSNTPTPRP